MYSDYLSVTLSDLENAVGIFVSNGDVINK